MIEIFKKLYADSPALALTMGIAAIVLFICFSLLLWFFIVNSGRRKVRFNSKIRQDESQRLKQLITKTRRSAEEAQELMNYFEEELEKKGRAIERRDLRLKELYEQSIAYEERIASMGAEMKDKGIEPPQEYVFKDNRSQRSLWVGILIGSLITGGAAAVYIFLPQIKALLSS